MTRCPVGLDVVDVVVVGGENSSTERSQSGLGKRFTQGSKTKGNMGVFCFGFCCLMVTEILCQQSTARKKWLSGKVLIMNAYFYRSINIFFKKCFKNY